MTGQVWTTRADGPRATRYGVSVTDGTAATRLADLATLTAARHAARLAELDHGQEVTGRE